MGSSGGDFGKEPRAAKALFILEAVHATVAGADSAVFEKAKSAFYFFREKAVPVFISRSQDYTTLTLQFPLQVNCLCFDI